LTSLAKVVAEILQARDFEVIERDGHMVARKNGQEVLLFLMGTVDRAAADAFIAKCRGHRGKKVIATLEAIPPAFLDGLDRSVTVWDRGALEHEIGRTRIERVVGERDHGLVDELMAEDYLDSRVVTFPFMFPSTNPPHSPEWHDSCT